MNVDDLLEPSEKEVVTVVWEQIEMDKDADMIKTLKGRLAKQGIDSFSIDVDNKRSRIYLISRKPFGRRR